MQQPHLHIQALTLDICPISPIQSPQTTTLTPHFIQQSLQLPHRQYTLSSIHPPSSKTNPHQTVTRILNRIRSVQRMQYMRSQKSSGKCTPSKWNYQQLPVKMGSLNTQESDGETRSGMRLRIQNMELREQLDKLSYQLDQLRSSDMRNKANLYDKLQIIRYLQANNTKNQYRKESQMKAKDALIGRLYQNIRELGEKVCRKEGNGLEMSQTVCLCVVPSQQNAITLFRLKEQLQKNQKTIKELQLKLFQLQSRLTQAKTPQNPKPNLPRTTPPTPTHPLQLLTITLPPPPTPPNNLILEQKTPPLDVIPLTQLGNKYKQHKQDKRQLVQANEIIFCLEIASLQVDVGQEWSQGQGVGGWEGEQLEFDIGFGVA